MNLDERVARKLWSEFAREGAYDEDCHNDVPVYLKIANEVIEMITNSAKIKNFQRLEISSEILEAINQSLHRQTHIPVVGTFEDAA